MARDSFVTRASQYLQAPVDAACLVRPPATQKSGLAGTMLGAMLPGGAGDVGAALGGLLGDAAAAKGAFERRLTPWMLLALSDSDACLLECDMRVRIRSTLLRRPYGEIVRVTHVDAAMTRQVAVEFDDEHALKFEMERRGRWRKYIGVVDTLTQRVEQAPRSPRATPNGTVAAGDDRLDHLSQLGDLRDRGILSDQEFAAEKARLLGA